MGRGTSVKMVFMGPPGCGKGTQASRVVDLYGLIQLSTGDMLRQAIAAKTQLGLEAKVFMDKGNLVPDKIIVDVMKESLSKLDCKDGYILDGFPRTVEQAKALDGMLDSSNEKLDLVVNFKVSDEEVVARLSGRRICRKCAQSYHVRFNPPKAEGICDKCKGELYQRDDDNEATIRNRLKVYREQTEPLVHYYRETGLLYDVDAQGEINKIFSDVCSLIDGVKKESV